MPNVERSTTVRPPASQRVDAGGSPNRSASQPTSEDSAAGFRGDFVRFDGDGASSSLISAPHYAGMSNPPQGHILSQSEGGQAHPDSSAEIGPSDNRRFSAAVLDLATRSAGGKIFFNPKGDRDLTIAQGNVLSVQIENENFQEIEKYLAQYGTKVINNYLAAVKLGKSVDQSVAKIGTHMRNMIEKRIDAIEFSLKHPTFSNSHSEIHEYATCERFIHLSEADDTALSRLLTQTNRGKQELEFRRKLLHSVMPQIHQHRTALRRFKGRFQELASLNSLSDDQRSAIGATVQEYQRFMLFNAVPLLHKLKAIVGPLSEIRTWFDSIKRIEAETRTENAAAYFEMFSKPKPVVVKTTAPVKRSKESKRLRGAPAARPVEAAQERRDTTIRDSQPSTSIDAQSAVSSAASNIRATAKVRPGFTRLNGSEGLYKGIVAYEAASRLVPQSHAVWMNLVTRFDPHCPVVSSLRHMTAGDAAACALRSDRQVPRILTVPNGRSGEAFLRTLAGRNGDFSSERLVADFAEALDAGLNLSIDMKSTRLRYFFGANRNEHEMRFETFGRLLAGRVKAEFEIALRELEMPGDRTRILDRVPKVYARMKQPTLSDLSERALEQLVLNENLRAVHVVTIPPERLAPSSADERKLAQPRVRALADGSGVYLYDGSHDAASGKAAGIIVPSLSDAITYCFDALNGRGIRQTYMQSHLAMLHGALAQCEAAAERFEFDI